MTDDIGAIEKALASIQATGGTLEFPRGQYAISRPIILDTTGVRIKGDGDGYSTRRGRASR